MARLVIHNEKITDRDAFIKICPFNALEIKNGAVEVNGSCKMCKLCVRKGPEGAAEIVEDQPVKSIDKSAWKGIAVYVDHEDGIVHPVTLELIGKARELANKINHPVYCIFIGAGIVDKAEELLHYGVDNVYVYDHEAFKHFRIDTYTSAFEDFVKNIMPTAILVGATNVGRQLAPRVAARFRTGLTADCTVLDIKENTDLVQIRPAFGGNIMAEIHTPNARPQLATVRYKVMNAPERNAEAKGKVTVCDLSNVVLNSDIEVIDVVPKAKEKFIENADVLVVAGRGVKTQEDLNMIHELADLLGGDVACTRPLIELGWFEAKKQIGLSGRTVRPKLIITCGVSGSVQFAAGMNNSEMIVAINKDEKAPIFKIAHYGIVGDLYEILPRLIAKIKAEKGA
ncbi:electron transfer flavoprotein subunit alpha [Clostridium thermosuccinogenes]|jgi:electron transfer flavoprotein alpha subunit|uniref:Electron transfer flavoprotein subunit alpha n=1 Tax=Clostridium thermosuccinogenes TaxID=84032 RepID=A0A2K2FB08_9CLOT|nr:electron transfer flavoprotein subunit alpha/FixB family protein [Pseudoclostridium thermosuccinogenes]AUS97204.1 electron transfer flavoprotein subunit alpha [Pseudoclostridium thermosuccinogenes]PNT92127.1 electron transfer flavoprotein subunit alpha [Pseudoclostridium thermosuccinogenes]PNT95947.1 electron transfer flavoprotein subunit alpha [Pseudoclostridium thermosuccinogenes]PNT97335.1 electron transfer flavoprotein subunit alpha [Pseudoclostridium thermosuccinogenes]